MVQVDTNQPSTYISMTENNDQQNKFINYKSFLSKQPTRQISNQINELLFTKI